MPEQTFDIAQITADYHAFRAGFRTLVLGTRSADQPQVSYAPFIEHDGALYIYVSELAAHTRQLLAYRCCAVLLIEDEAQCRNLFARRRISYRCQVSEIDRDSEAGQQLLAQMQAVFGNIVDLLRSLSDFHLLRLEILDGSYVAGFGKAFAIQADGTLEHVARL